MTQAEIGARRLLTHPVLGDATTGAVARVTCDGRELAGVAGEPIAAALIAHGVRVFHTLPESGGPRGLFCGVGRCVDCLMTVDGEPNVRACVTPLRDGMRIVTQRGLGEWEAS